jgi:P-type conjugative transfer ATPase TrbB
MEANYLWEKLGSQIQQGLQDDNVFEVILNPDCSLWFKHKTKGMLPIGNMDESLANSFVHALAQYENKFLNDKTPYLDAILPFSGERVNVTVPPLNQRVSFNIRKKAKLVFTLEHYVESQIITRKQADLLTDAIKDRKNILISGSPASGKTTFANALLDVMSKVVPEGHRVLVLEQVPELQCNVKNIKTMLISEHVTMNRLLWIAMRNSPDRIVIGEVRDGAALDMLKAWNTGCPGGLATIHANSSQAAVQRVLDLACEIVTTPPYLLAAEALDVIVQIEERSAHPAGRIVTEVMAVKGFDTKNKIFQFEKFA